MIPRIAAICGILAVVPFLAGASLARWTTEDAALNALAADNWLLVHYGTVMLCFLAGVLWGFATRAEGAEAVLAYTLATLPALFAATALLPLHSFRIELLLAAYIALLALDFWFWNEGLAPGWWMRLRALMSVVVLVSLGSAL
ncbi:DUF3429 domain-containing protein [Gemmobacter caeruleus]|uniref:DUF3429 domain-containing protein n=1 Tax=Gemmobacter caeruleus TaxID=2595004 RepID=UPI0011F01349|nr:DUF3429 domain-containing protein [Gemmobacter caeruleus]